MPFVQPPKLKASMFGRMPVGGEKPKGQGGLPAHKGPKGIYNETRIGIQAPAEVIWELIYDVNDWGRWNPLYPKASGEIHLGAELQLTAQLPGMAPMDLKSTVLEWVPNEQLHLGFKALGGLVRIIRYIEIEELAAESCVVANGEITAGILASMVVKASGAQGHRGMRSMNEALKVQAEARWADRSA